MAFLEGDDLQTSTGGVSLEAGSHSEKHNQVRAALLELRDILPDFSTLADEELVRWDASAGRLVRVPKGTYATSDEVDALALGGTYQGAWDSGTAYAGGDIVEHDGSTYAAGSATTAGEEPGVAAAWQVVIDGAAALKRDGGYVFDVTHPHFGATGDGSTDDAAAIQAAVDAAEAAGGGIVFFPVGTYLVQTGIAVDAGVYLLGAGRQATIIEYDQTSGWALTITGTDGNDSFKGGGFSRLTFSVSGAGGNGVRLVDTRHIVGDDFAIAGGGLTNVVAASVGLQFEFDTGGSAWNHLRNFYIEYCDTGMVLDGGSLSFCNRNFIAAGHVQSCTTYGLHLIDCNTNQMQVSTQDCGTGVYLATGGAGTGCDRNYLLHYGEGNTLDIEIATSVSQANVLIGNFHRISGGGGVTDNGTDTFLLDTTGLFQAPAYASPINWHADGGAGSFTPAGGELGTFNFFSRNDSGSTVNMLGLEGGVASPRVIIRQKALALGEVEVDGTLNHDGSNAGFFGAAPVAQQSITGSTDSEKVTSIIAALVALGLATDDTT